MVASVVSVVAITFVAGLSLGILPKVTHSSLTASVGSVVSSVTPELTLYVSTKGNDTKVGTSIPDALLTIKRAVILANTTYAGKAVAIRILSGNYFVTSTINIESTAGPLDIRPYNNGFVSIYQGIQMTLTEKPEKINDFRAFSAIIPASVSTSTMQSLVRQSAMRIQGGYAEKARYPNSSATNKGFLGAKAGKTTIPEFLYTQASTYCPGDTANPLKAFVGDPAKSGSIAAPSLPEGYDLSNAFINIYLHDSWGNSVAPVRLEGSYLVSNGIEPLGGKCNAPEEGSRYFLENIPQALDTAGEFYINPETRELTWLAPKDFPVDKTTALASLPTLRTAFAIKGGDTRIISNLKISDGLAPMEPGAAKVLDSKRVLGPAIRIDRGSNIVIENNEMFNVASGVGGNADATKVTIRKNTIRNTYGGGLYLFGASDVLIEKNTLINLGTVDKDARGIQGGFLPAPKSVITGNYIERTPAGGISCAACTNTEVTYNTVRMAVNDVSDTGALHTGGTQEAPMRWQNNYVYMTTGVGTDAAGKVRTGISNVGYYADTGANNQTIVGNIIAGPMNHDMMPGIFDNYVAYNLLLGQNTNSGNPTKLRSFSAYSTRTTGMLTVLNNFAFGHASQSAKYTAQKVFGGIPMLVHYSDPKELERITASGNTFVINRTFSAFECEYINAQVEAIAPYMNQQYCAVVAKDLAYLKCGTPTPTTCDTKSSVASPITTPEPTTCSLTVTPGAVGQPTTVAWTTTNAQAFTFLSPAALTSNELTGSLSFTPAVGTTTISAQAYGAGGLASCSSAAVATIPIGIGTVSGRVYVPANGTVTYAPGNTVLSGRLVTLSGAKFATTTTGVDGTYSFSGLLPGDYRITHNVPEGYTRATDNSSPFTLSEGAMQKEVPFAIRLVVTTTPTPITPLPTPSTEPVPYRISGVVFTDSNKNKKVEVDETLWAGRTVKLISATKTISVVTNDQGAYTFTDFVADTYRVWHIVPDGYLRTTDNSYYPVIIGTSTPTQILNFGFAADPALGN